MKLVLPKSPLARLLVGLGLFLIVAAGLIFMAGLSARQSVEAAQRLAQTHAAELARELDTLQARLVNAEIERSAQAVLRQNSTGSETLLATLRTAGFEQVLTAQVFEPDLESLRLGDFPDPDFTTLEMLLEARRSGQALPEARVLADQSSHLALARRLGSLDQPVNGILLVRLPVQSLVDQVAWSADLNFVALSQGLGDRRTVFWHQGNRPDREVARSPVPGTRFWLEWHRSTVFPPFGLREASILGLGGLILLLFGVREQIPAGQLSLPALGLAKWARRLRKGDAGAPDPVRAEPNPPGLASVEGGSSTEATAALPIEEAETESEGERQVEVPLGLESEADAVSESPQAPSVTALPDAGSGDLADDDETQQDLAAAAADQSGASTAAPETVPQELELMVDTEAPAEAPELAEAEDPPESKIVPEQESDAGFEQTAAQKPTIKPESRPGPKPTRKSKPSPRRSNQPAPVEPRLFTDAGILGRFEAGLDARSATLIGQAIASAAVERGVDRIAVARDGRLHGPVLLAGLSQGLRSGGLDVLDLGAVPAPLLDFAANDLPGRSSVMVSAAHLPGDWNGFRIQLGGEVLIGEAIHELLDRVRSAGPAGRQGQLEEVSIIGPYLKAVSARVQLERPLKVVVDCANSVAGLVLPRLLSAVGADVVPLYADVDGSFPNHLPDPSRLENLEDLRLCVRNFRADLGLAIGGDGDRVVMIGPDGAVIWPDRLLMLLARDLLARQAEAVIVQDAMCSPRLESYLGKLGGSVQVTDLGPAAVARALQAQGGVLGGTFGGQIFMAEDWNGGADALFAACRLLEILAADTRETSEILAELPSWFSLPAAFLPTRPTAPDRVLDQLLETADVSDAEVGSEHGFSIDFGHAWARICRSADGSGLLIRFDGDDEAAAQRLALLVRQLLLAVDERLQVPF